MKPAGVDRRAICGPKTAKAEVDKLRVPFRTARAFLIADRSSPQISLGGGVKANTLRAGNDARCTRESRQRVFADKSARAKSVERLRNDRSLLESRDTCTTCH
jgi:hypothetical protein